MSCPFVVFEPRKRARLYGQTRDFFTRSLPMLCGWVPDAFFFTLCRPPTEFIPPVQEPYQYIIFRASEVKDLSVDEPAAAPLRNVHDDPAVLGVCHSRHHISIFHFLRLPLFAERNNNIPGKTCPLGATPSIISIFSPRIYF